MRAIEQRLARLEQALSPRETVHIWAGADAGEAADQAIAARLPDGLPNGVTVMVYRWAGADQ